MSGGLRNSWLSQYRRDTVLWGGMAGLTALALPAGAANVNSPVFGMISPLWLLVAVALIAVLLVLVLYGWQRGRLLRSQLKSLSLQHRRLRAAFDVLPDPVTIKSADGHYLDCNDRFVQYSGRTKEQIVGRSTADLFSAADALRIAAEDRLVLNSGTEHRIEEWIHLQGQRPRLVSYLRCPLRVDGEQALLLVSRDITVRRHDEIITRLQNITLDCLVRGVALSTVLEKLVRPIEDAYPDMPCTVMMLDRDQRLYTVASAALPDTFLRAIDGLPAVEGAGACGTAAARARRVVIEDVEQHSDTRAFCDVAREARVAACWSEPVLGSRGEVLGTFCIYAREPGLPTPVQTKLVEQVVRLVSLAVESSRSEEQLRKLSRAVEQSSSMVIITDADGLIEYINEEFCEVTGFARDEVLGRNPSLLKSGETDEELYREMWHTLRAGRDWHGEIRNRKKNGELFWTALSISPIVEEDGTVTHFIGISEDISAQKQSQAQIEQLAFYDPLTQLGNRRLFREQLDQELRKVRRSGGQLALFYLDLDNFKQINDTLGHDVGDRLLQAIAGRLKSTLRESDIIARLGGDEFIIMLPQVNGPAQARRVAEKLLSALLTPVSLAGHEVLITFSIGITLAPDDGDTWSVLMKNSDLAMYRAKRHGRNNFQFFTREMNEEVMRRARMEGELRTALEDRQFRLHFQPQWNLLGELQLVAVEALIRWHHAERGWISPAEFVPVAEELGLIVPMGHWVIREACRAGRALVDQGHHVRVAVNLSLRQFRDPMLMDTVRQALDDAGLAPRYLEFEITESMIMEDIERVLEILGALKALGVTLAIDDFGTGYSSLSYLKRLPVDQLKVDASFVRDIPHDRNDMEIAAAVIAMAHKLGLQVVAEGIETHEQLAFLRENRCEMGQGYLLARPVPLDEVMQLLEIEIDN